MKRKPLLVYRIMSVISNQGEKKLKNVCVFVCVYTQNAVVMTLVGKII